MAMVIQWRGGNCFKIESQGSALVLDPASSASGSKNPKLEADAVVFSSPEEKDKMVSAKDAFFSIVNPGEYDVKEFFIVGLSNLPDKPIHLIEAEGIKVCHISQVSKKELSDEQLSAIGTVDVLLIAAEKSIDGASAAKLANEIEPRIVIPADFSGEKPDQFLKEMGGSESEPLAKLSLKRKDLPQEETKVFVLSQVK